MNAWLRSDRSTVSWDEAMAREDLSAAIAASERAPIATIFKRSGGQDLVEGHTSDETPCQIASDANRPSSRSLSYDLFHGCP